MADNVESATKFQDVFEIGKLRKLSFAELASMLHGLLFAYEKVFINLHGDDARQLYPYIIEELAHLFHVGEDPIIDKRKSLEENIERVLFFISNEEYVEDIQFEKVEENRYLFKIGACTFAKSGVHDILKVKEGICPFALVVASCLTELSPNKYVKIGRTEFDEDGSKTYLELTAEEGEHRDKQTLRPGPLSDMDNGIFTVPAKKSPLDEMDMRIVKELRRDSRQSNVDIAKMIGTTESTVRRRINSLRSRGIIRSFTTLLRYAPGETILRAFIGIRADPKFIDGLAARLSSAKETCSVYRSIGKHNLICETIFINRAKFQEFIDEFQYVEGVIELEYSIASSAPKPCPWYGF
jgi:Lrp/AsnC family leucine-responsive transcriptional regulator